MAHGHCTIMFFIKQVGNGCDQWLRYDLADKYSAAFPLRSIKMFDVKAQVYLLEINMQRPFDAFYSGIVKQKTHHAHQAFSLPQVELGSWWYMGL